MTNEERVKLWDAVNRVVKASGGATDNTSYARQRSVIVLEGTVDEMMDKRAQKAYDLLHRIWREGPNLFSERASSHLRSEIAAAIEEVTENPVGA